ILPSILDFLGVKPDKKLYYGLSVFGPNEGRMLNYASGQYLLLKGDKLLSFDGQKSKLFQIKSDQLQKIASASKDFPKDFPKEFSELLLELKGYIQYTNN